RPYNTNAPKSPLPHAQGSLGTTKGSVANAARDGRARRLVLQSDRGRVAWRSFADLRRDRSSSRLAGRSGLGTPKCAPAALAPRPRVGDLLRRGGKTRRTAEPRARPRRVGDERGRVARPPRPDPHRDIAAGDAAGDVDQLAHRPAASGADVERTAGAAADQVAPRAYVRVGEVADVDVVANAGAVRGRIVVAEDRESRDVARRRVEDERDGVRLGHMAFAD